MNQNLYLIASLLLYSQTNLILDGALSELFYALAQYTRCTRICYVITHYHFWRGKVFLQFCVVCWLWKHKNGLVFNSLGHISIRNLICILCLLWTISQGHSVVLAHEVNIWLLEDLEMTPLQVVRPVPQLTMGGLKNS
jgi:hypothetical protein